MIVSVPRFDWFCSLQGWRTIGGSSGDELNRYYPGCRGGNIPYILAYKSSHIVVYGYIWSSAIDITEDARAKIIDTPLTLIFKMAYGAYSIPYCAKRRPILSFSLHATSRPSDYTRYTTNNHWRCFATHFQEVVGYVSLVVVNIMVAGTSETISYVPLSICCI
jgi:hypothetical protein